MATAPLRKCMLVPAGTPVIDSPTASVTTSCPSTVTRTMTAFRCSDAIVSRTARITASALVVSVGRRGRWLTRQRAGGATGEHDEGARTPRAGAGRRACPGSSQSTTWLCVNKPYKWAFQCVSVLAEWFLTVGERGNPDWDLAAWREGNQAEALIHGASYFDRLVTEVEQLGPGDHLFFADWRGDADQRLREDGPTVAELFRAAAERGVLVKGLMWRSYPNMLQFNEEQNRHLAETIERAGGEVLLDQRVLHRRVAPSAAGRCFVIPTSPIATSHSSAASTCATPAATTSRTAAIRRRCRCPSRYGERPPWHDVQLQLRGPVVGALDTTFRERWTARAPLNLVQSAGLAARQVSRAPTRRGIHCRSSRPIRRAADRTRCRCCGPTVTR